MSDSTILYLIFETEILTDPGAHQLVRLAFFFFPTPGAGFQACALPCPALCGVEDGVGRGRGGDEEQSSGPHSCTAST